MDDLDIQKQTSSLYARANILKRRFSAASLHNKCMNEMNENARILSAFENRLRAGFV